MIQRGIKDKIVAILLIITLTFANLALSATVFIRQVVAQDEKIQEEMSTELERPEIEADLSMVKSIPFDYEGQKGLLIQTNIQIGLTNLNFPIKQTNITTAAPVIAGEKPSKVIVTAISTMATNADRDGIDFENEAEIQYNETENKVNIELTNPEERAGRGKDIYQIAYIYSENTLEEIEENYIIGGMQVEIELQGIEDKIVKTIESLEQPKINMGNIVDAYIQSLPKNLGKGFLYTNEEINYAVNVTLEIADQELTPADLYLQESPDQYQDDEGFINQVSSIYKRTRIKKRSFDKILGQEGRLEIWTEMEAGELLAEITPETIEYLIKTDESTRRRIYRI